MQAGGGAEEDGQAGLQRPGGDQEALRDKCGERGRGPGGPPVLQPRGRGLLG